MIDSGSSSKSFAVVTLQTSVARAIYVNGIEKGTGTDPNTPAAFDKIKTTLPNIAKLSYTGPSMQVSVRSWKDI